MPRKPKTPKSKMYFTLETEQAIIAYNKSENLREKNTLYIEEIKYPFEKIAENVLNTYKSGEIMKSVTGRADSSELTKDYVTNKLISANISSTTIPQKLPFCDSESCDPVL